MKTVLIIEKGIHIWQSTCQIDSPEISTLTLLSVSKENLVIQLRSIFFILTLIFESIYRWHSMRLPFSGNKIQELKLKRELGANLVGFNQTLLRCTKSKVWHNLSMIVFPFSDNHFDCLSDPTRESILLFKKKPIDFDGLASEFDRFAERFSEQDVLGFLNKHPGAVVGKVFDDDTHAAFQLIGQVGVIDTVIKSIEEIGIKKIDRVKASEFINNN